MFLRAGGCHEETGQENQLEMDFCLMAVMSCHAVFV